MKLENYSAHGHNIHPVKVSIFLWRNFISKIANSVLFIIIFFRFLDRINKRHKTLWSVDYVTWWRHGYNMMHWNNTISCIMLGPYPSLTSWHVTCSTTSAYSRTKTLWNIQLPWLGQLWKLWLRNICNWKQ